MYRLIHTHTHIYIYIYILHIYICFIYIYMYIYIYPPAPSGAIRLRRICCNLPVPSSLNHKLTVKFSIHFNSFPILQSAISCLPIWYQLLAVFRSASVSDWFLMVSGRAKKYPVTLPGVCNLNLGSPRAPLKNHHISRLSPGPLKIRKSVPRVSKKPPKRHPKPFKLIILGIRLEI